MLTLSHRRDFDRLARDSRGQSERDPRPALFVFNKWKKVKGNYSITLSLRPVSHFIELLIFPFFSCCTKKHLLYQFHQIQVKNLPVNKLRVIESIWNANFIAISTIFFSSSVGVCSDVMSSPNGFFESSILPDVFCHWRLANVFVNVRKREKYSINDEEEERRKEKRKKNSH